MQYISLDPSDRLHKIFHATASDSDFQCVFISESLLHRKIHSQEPIFDPAVLKKLTQDRSTIIIISSITEIIDSNFVRNCKQQFEQLDINLSRVHFVVVSDPQKRMVQNAVPEFKVSVFNYWQHLTPYVVRSWKFQTADPIAQKRFLYLNRRCSSDRAYIFYNLWRDSAVQNNTHASMHRGIYWDRTIDAETYFQQCIGGLQSHPDFEKIKKFYSKTTLPVLQKNLQAYDYDFFGEFDKTLMSFYKNSSVSIVVESHPHHAATAFMPTEKLYRSIATGQPFVVFGVQNYYQNLQAQGYQFAEIPCYDSEPDLYIRAKMFAKYVKKLANSSTSEWNRYLTQAHRYTQYNQDILKQRNQHSSRCRDFDPQLQQWLKTDLNRV